MPTLPKVARRRTCLSLAALAASFALATAAAAGDDGWLDGSFDGDGVQTIAFDRPPAESDLARDIEVQPDGKILLAGEACAVETFDSCLVGTVRLLPNGQLDSSFNGDGKAAFAFGNSTDCGATSILVRPQDGKIVVVGWSDVDDKIGLARLTTAGLFDSSFGAVATPGSILHALPAGTLGNVAAGALQADGKILVGGYGHQTCCTDDDFFIVRFTETGQLDSSFSGDGIAWVNFDLGGSNGDELDAIAVQANGLIVAIGEVERASGDTDTGLVRLLANGNVDLTFDGDGGSGNGRVVWEVPDLFESQKQMLHHLWLRADGRILFSGSVVPTGGDFAVFFAQILSGGQTDPALVIQSPNLLAAADEFGGEILVQSDGKLVLGVDPLNGTCAVARFNAGGTALDPSFGESGVAEFDGGPTTTCQGFALQGGRVVAGGFVRPGAPDYNFAAMRLASDLIFKDGFTAGNTSSWSAVVP